jgi:uncharacterized membrane protein
MLSTQTLLLFFSALLSALVAGLLYGYACSVNPGLNKLNDASYLQAMQSINKEILNPYFFITFFGALIILPITTWYSYAHLSKTCFLLLLASTIIYIAGVIGVTISGNVPLNESLAKFNIKAATEMELAQQRKLFENSWNRFHLLRTIFSVLAASLTILAIIKRSFT